MTLPPGAWQHTCMTADDVSTCPGCRADLLAELEALEAERDCLVLELDRVRAALDGNVP